RERRPAAVERTRRADDSGAVGSLAASMGCTGRRGRAFAAALVLGATALGAPAAATAGNASATAARLVALRGEGRYAVAIRRAAHGTPHILARDYGSLGYGYGYAFAQDHLCTIAASYMTVRAP